MLSVSNVHFLKWRPHSILKSSVIEVEKESDLSSPLLGVVFGGKCPTCYQTKHNCPGHFGSIRLTEPVYHISWIPHLLRQLKQFEGKFTWDKHKASVLRNGEFPSRERALFYDGRPPGHCSAARPASPRAPSSLRQRGTERRERSHIPTAKHSQKKTKPLRN